MSADVRMVPSDLRASVAEELYARLPRNRLQQAVAESKLVPRSETRAYVKQVCADAEKWVVFVERAIDGESTRDLGVRLLGSLCETYVRSTPPATRNRFEELRRAADRQDRKKFMAEIEKISCLPGWTQAQSVEFLAAVAWLRNPSDKYRERIARMFSWDGSGNAPQPAAVSVAPHLAEPDQAASQTQEPDSERLIQYLKLHTQQPTRPTWGISDIKATAVLPVAHIAIPDLTTIIDGISSLRERLHRLTEAAEWNAGPGALPRAVEALRSLADAGEAANDLLHKSETLLTECNTRVYGAPLLSKLAGPELVGG